jgi:phosphate transport system permease protein
MAVLPFCRPGVTSAVLLGFGRAIGETIAIALVLSSSFTISGHIIQSGGNTVAANIANYYGDAQGVGRGALIATGLVLFVITLIINSGARLVVARAARRAQG